MTVLRLALLALSVAMAGLHAASLAAAHGSAAETLRLPRAKPEPDDKRHARLPAGATSRR